MKFLLPLLLAAGLNACETNKSKPTSQATFQGQNDTVLESPASATPAHTQETSVPAFPEASANAVYSYQLITADKNTFGYEIKQENRTLIRQATVPGMPGNAGFATKEAAEKVAELVITKLKKGEMPPTVSEAEMKNLGAIK